MLGKCGRRCRPRLPCCLLARPPRQRQAAAQSAQQLDCIAVHAGESSHIQPSWALLRQQAEHFSCLPDQLQLLLAACRTTAAAQVLLPGVLQHRYRRQVQGVADL